MTRLPTIFFGHGTPMIALQENATTTAWREVFATVPRPRAILCISAHWMTRGIGVTAQPNPPTIHDFGGFPRAMHEFQYPAPGSMELARRVEGLLAPHLVHSTDIWGFDHGCWTVLMKIVPEVDIPVIQLSIDATRTARDHYEFGKLLAPLRDEGVLIMGTGNIVHNLGDVIRTDDAPPRDYALNFGSKIRQAATARDAETLIGFEALDGARQSLPTNEHYLPLLYVAGASDDADRTSFACDFVQYSSIDMTTVVFSPA